MTEPDLLIEAVNEWQDARRAVLALPPADNTKPLEPERIAAYVRLGKAENTLYALKVDLRP